MRRADWVPPIAWMAVIIALSTDTGSAEHTGGFLLPALRWIWPAATPSLLDAGHFAIRKLAHVTEYAVLAGLWYRGLVVRRRPPRAAATALALSIVWACVDESFQTLIPSRTASVIDVGVDATGALVACVATAGWPRPADLVTSALLWTAMLVGCAVLVGNAVAGVGSGGLWVTTSAAALAIVARGRVSA